jgi:hypothetical protein
LRTQLVEDRQRPRDLAGLLQHVGQSPAQAGSRLAVARRAQRVLQFVRGQVEVSFLLVAVHQLQAGVDEVRVADGDALEERDGLRPVARFERDAPGVEGLALPLECAGPTGVVARFAEAGGRVRQVARAFVGFARFGPLAGRAEVLGRACGHAGVEKELRGPVVVGQAGVELGRLEGLACRLEVLGRLLGVALALAQVRQHGLGTLPLTFALEGLRGGFDVPVHVWLDGRRAALEDDGVAGGQVDGELARAETVDLDPRLDHAVAAADGDAVRPVLEAQLGRSVPRVTQRVACTVHSDGGLARGSRAPHDAHFDRAARVLHVELELLALAPGHDRAALVEDAHHQLPAGFVAQAAFDRHVPRASPQPGEVRLAADLVALPAVRYLARLAS